MQWILSQAVFLQIILSNIGHASTGTILRIYIRDDKPALKGSNIQLVCQISEFSKSDTLQVYKSDSRFSPSADDKMTDCLMSLCLTATNGRYTFSADNSNVYINIRSLDRTEDQKWWIFVLVNSGRKDTMLNVFTAPTSLQYENPPSKDVDLAQNAVELKCHTGCSYPKPTFTWYYSEPGKDSLQTWLPSVSSSETTAGCTDSERKYFSNLSLPRKKIFLGNIQKTVKFKCSIQSFTGMPQPLYTNYSTNIQFAVQVSSATLKDGSNTVSGQLQVVSGVSKTLTCETSVSRPAATIVWYIGTEKQQSTSKTFTFNPQNSDNSEQVYCKAFNTQPENQAVISYKSTLYVQVQVSSATLKDGSSTVSGQLQVVSGVSKTLTCKTSVSRPAATIVWYIGTKPKQTSTSKTFKFNPQNSDHNTQVYCKAFNTQPESQAVVSNKPTLYVTVYATTPSLTNKTTGSMILLENDPITMECKTSATRPAATVTWWKGSSSLTIIQNTNISHGNLISVKSVVSFTPSKADDRKVISCQSFVSDQDNRPKAQQTITVYWPPVTPTSIPTSEFPFLENQTGKSIYCSSQDYGNPPSTARWNKQYGSLDNSDSRRLNLPTLTSQMDGSFVSCQLDNHFTQVKGSTVKSLSVKLEVEYNPIVHIMVDGIITKSVTRNEGQTLSALCNATGNPTPTAKWIGQNPSSSNLTLHDIDRKNHGRYTCRAEATSKKYRNHDFVTETIIDVNVNYAPNVYVLISEADPVENISLQIRCAATGRPANYTFISMVQTWRGIKISNAHLPGNFNGVINIQKLQLEDSGTYTCHVNNGISDRYQKLDQIGKTDVSVKVSPKVMHVGESKFAGRVGTSVNITIPFYSYPEIVNVAFKFENGSEIKNSSKHKVFYIESKVEDMFYGQKVELDGSVAVLYIMDEVEYDFKNYTLVLQNGIGQPTEWIFKHVSESVPLPPLSFSFDGIVNGVPKFTLVGGFNGGSDQTFIVETAVDGTENWKERVRFNESDKAFLTNNRNTYSFNLTGLDPNKYDVRVLTENSNGRIEETKALFTEFTITSDDNIGGGYMALIGSLCGGGAALILIVVLGAIVFKRRGTFIKGKAKRYQENSDRKPVNEDDDDYGMQENPTYVSAGPRGQAAGGSGGAGAVYSTVDKKKNNPDSNKSDVYAEVDKTRRPKESVPDNVYSMPLKQKGKKEKEKKEKNKHGIVKDKKGKKATQEGDIYENATPANQAKNDEIIYENPEPSKEVSKKNVNKDGLIYADLTFNDQPKGQKKLVIHGLDDMTEYVQVDFTKKAEPLPDSDDENNPPK